MSSVREWICTQEGGWRRRRPLVSVSVIMNHPTICHRLPLHLVHRWRNVCTASFISFLNEICPTHYKYKTIFQSSSLEWSTFHIHTHKHTKTHTDITVHAGRKQKKSTKQTKQAACSHIHIYIYKISVWVSMAPQWPALRNVSVAGVCLSVASALMKQRSGWSRARRRARRRAVAVPSFRCSSEHLAPSQQDHLRGDGQERSQGRISSPWRSAANTPSWAALSLRLWKGRKWSCSPAGSLLEGLWTPPPEPGDMGFPPSTLLPLCSSLDFSWWFLEGDLRPATSTRRRRQSWPWWWIGFAVEKNMRESVNTGQTTTVWIKFIHQGRHSNKHQRNLLLALQVLSMWPQWQRIHKRCKDTKIYRYLWRGYCR